MASHGHQDKVQNPCFAYKGPAAAAAAAAAKSLQSCPTVRPHRRQPTRLPRPWDSPGKNTGVGCHFLLQCIKVKVKSLSHVRLLSTPWTAAHQAPPSMGFSRQEHWSGVPFPSPTKVLQKGNSYLVYVISLFPVVSPLQLCSIFSQPQDMPDSLISEPFLRPLSLSGAPFHFPLHLALFLLQIWIQMSLTQDNFL